MRISALWPPLERARLPFRILVAAAMLAPFAFAAGAQVDSVRAARSCPTVSGYIYHDANDNGLRDPGETPIGGGTIELRAESGDVVGSTVADEDGYYEFFFDGTQQAPEASNSFKAIFPTAVTNWAESKDAPPFDSQDGTLVAVDITQTATITSSIEAESRDSKPTSLTATVSGEVTVAVGEYAALAVPAVQAGQFAAQAYDGTSDFAGPSGHDFGQHTASDTSTVTVQGDDLAAFTGIEPVVVSATVNATSNTSGSGNVLNLISTTASVEATLIYRFVPHTCLTGASYTIVQIEQPAGYGDGRETAGNQQPIPGSSQSDQISITVADDDLPNNNFGELLGSLAGFVYVDFDDDGIFDASEPPIPGVDVGLLGQTFSGEPVDIVMATLQDGSYLFDGLFAGTYQILETQPLAYLDGKDTIGSQGGNVAADEFGIGLSAGVHGIENNFGELLYPTATATMRSSTVFPSLTPTPDGTPDPTPDYDVEVAKTPGAPGSGSGLAAVGKAEINLLLGVIFLVSIAAGVLLMMLGRSEPTPRP